MSGETARALADRMKPDEIIREQALAQKDAGARIGFVGLEDARRVRPCGPAPHVPRSPSSSGPRSQGRPARSTPLARASPAVESLGAPSVIRREMFDGQAYRR